MLDRLNQFNPLANLMKAAFSPLQGGLQISGQANISAQFGMGGIGNIGSSFQAAAGAGLGFAFGGLPPANFMPPMPPMGGMGASGVLQQLGGLLQGLTQQLGGLGNPRMSQGVGAFGGFGALAQTGNVLGGFVQGQEQLKLGQLGFGAMGGVQANVNVNFNAQIQNQTQYPAIKKTEDPFSASGMGKTGLKSNLANSPEVTMAMHSILKDKGSMKFDELSKQLKEKYGIDSEVVKVKDDKGKEMQVLQFANGDKLVDGNGNGAADMGDYKFKDALKDIETKYGVTPEKFEAAAKEGRIGGLAKGGGASATGNVDFGAQLQQLMSGLSNMWQQQQMQMQLQMNFSLAFKYAQ